MSSPYLEYPPDPVLRPWVECFWSKRVDAEPGSGDFTRVVPDGSVDILVEVRSGGGDLIGTMLRPKLIRHHQPIDLVAVRFRPGGAQPFLGFAAREITDKRVDLDAAGLPGAESLGHRVAEAPTTGERVAVLQRQLVGRLGAVEPPHPVVREAVRQIASTAGGIEVGVLAQRLGVGRRRLGRLFARHVGASPKQLCRTVRMQRVLHALGTRDRDPDWIEIALECGFFDQSHLVREFRELTGTTPTRWIGERHAGRAPTRPPASSHPYKTGPETIGTLPAI